MNTLRKSSTQASEKGATRKTKLSITKAFDPENYLKLEWLQANAVYLTLVAFLLILYIGLTHRAEKTIKNIHQAERDLKDLRSDFISIKSELMYMSKASEVEKQVNHLGLKTLKVPPRKLEGDEK